MQITDDSARIALLVGIATVAPVGIYHRLRSRTAERLDRRQEGWLILATLRPLGIAFIVGLAAFLIEPQAMQWASFRLPNWVRCSGMVFGLGAGGLIIWTFCSLGHNLTDTVVTRRNATLVTSGPYRWVRHPFYLACVLAVIATTWLTANAFLALIGAAAFLVIVARTSIEERFLVDRFGNDYVEYRRRTGRFLPRIRRWPS